MKIGYLTTHTKSEAERAKRLGFDCLEIHSGSWHGDKVFSSPTERQTILDDLKRMKDEHGIAVTAIAHYGPGLNLKGKDLHQSYENAIDIAANCGAGVVSTIVSRTQPEKTVADNIPAFKDAYGPISTIAADKNVKIAVENWPAFRGYPWQGQTMAYSPEAWDLMFNAVPGEAFGLEFDPSHLYWQGIDHIWALRKYKSKVHHVHAKDTEIFKDTQNRIGIYGTDGWWTYRIPGLGELDWPKFINELHIMEYKGGICIEHEDNRFDAGRKKPDLKEYEQGLRIGLATLRPLIG